MGHSLQQVLIDKSAGSPGEVDAHHVELHVGRRAIEVHAIEFDTPSSLHPYAEVCRPIVFVAGSGRHERWLAAIGEGQEAARELLSRHGHRFQALADEATDPPLTEVARDLGTIRAVATLRTLAWHTAPRWGEGFWLDLGRGAEIPAGVAYGQELAHPRDPQATLELTRLTEVWGAEPAAAEVDVAISLSTTRTSVVVYAEAITWLKVFLGDNLPEDLATVVDEIPLTMS